MDPLLELFAILAVVYLIECVTWSRRGSVGLRALDRAFAVALPSTVAGNPQAGFVWANPLPPLGTLFIAEAWPLALSPDGMATREPLELTRGMRTLFARRALRWEDAVDLRAVGRDIFVGRERFARMSSARGAVRLVELAVEVRDLTREQRGSAIVRAIERSLDMRVARERSQQFEQHTRVLRTLCNAQFTCLAIVAPFVVFRWGLLLTWPWLVAAIAVLHVAILVATALAQRRIGIDDAHARRATLFALALSPPHAVRALDLVAAPVLADLHPVAASALAPAEQRDFVARTTLVDARFPRNDASAPDDLGARCDAWFRSALANALERRLAAEHVDAARLLAPPQPEDELQRRYCPRCSLQVAREDAELCHDCSTPLQPLAAR